MREVVGSVLRVKPDRLRDDQPLTDLGLDSLMGVEIENSLEAAIGVALPPTSLMRARTIGQIATLDRRPPGRRRAGVAGSAAPSSEPAPTDEVDLDALSDEDIDRLLGDADATAEKADTSIVRKPSLERLACPATNAPVSNNGWKAVKPASIR